MKIKNTIITGILLILLINIGFVIAAESSSTEVQFYNTFNVPYCYTPNNFESFWVFGGEWQDSRSSTAPAVGCYNDTGFPSTDCCPISASICREDSGDYYCGPGPTHCNELSEPECNKGYPIIAKNDLETGGNILESQTCNSFNGRYDNSETCYNYNSCQCEWTNNKCQTISELMVYDGTTFHNTTGNLEDDCGASIPPQIGKCSFDFNITDNCAETGFLKRKWTVDWIGTGGIPNHCAQGNDKIMCVKTVKLSFFNIANFIIALFIVILIYIFKNKFSRKK